MALAVYGAAAVAMTALAVCVGRQPPARALGLGLLWPVVMVSVVWTTEDDARS